MILKNMSLNIEF